MDPSSSPQKEDLSPQEEYSHPIAQSGRRAKHQRAPQWQQRLEIIVRHFVVRLLQLLAILIVFGIPLLLVVTSTHGLGDGIRSRFEKALSGKFYEVKIHRLFFSINEGLIAENLKLLEQSPSHRLLVNANRVALSPKLSSLAQGKLEVDAFQLKHTTIDIPLSNAEEPRLRLTHVKAKIVSSPGQIHLRHASFNLCGINVSVHGSFLNPKTFFPQPVSKKGPGKVAQAIDAIQQQLKQIQWGPSQPYLDMEVSGDLTNTESIRIDSITLRSKECCYKGWQLKEVTADLEYANSILKIQHLLLEDRIGEFYVTGNANFRTKQSSIDFSGACDLPAVINFLLKQEQKNHWTMIDPPHLEGSFQGDWSSGKLIPKGEVHAEEGRFTYDDIPMEKISVGCSVDGDRFLIRDLKILGSPGWVYADLMIAPKDYRLRVSANILPQLLTPVIPGKAKEFFLKTDFKDPAKLNFEAYSSEKDPFAFVGSGNLILGQSSVRGAWLDSCTADIMLDDGAFTFKNIVTKIGKEIGQGECIYDFKNQEARFPKVVSNLNPVTIMEWIDPHIADSLKDYRFHQNPELELKGMVGLHNPQKNNLKINVNASKGLDYTLIRENLPFGSVKGTVIVKKQELLVNIPQAELFGGNIDMKAEVSLIPKDGHYTSSIHMDGVDLKSITKLYFDYDTSEGKLTADYDFTTITGDDYAMKGKGNLLIKDGNVLAMPVFGPLSFLMNDIVPGLGYQAARRATANFTVEKGVITTRNLSIQSAEFSMIGSGKIYYLEDRMNMSIRLNIKGLPGLVFFPVSKLFEYVSDGSAKHPSWRPKFMTLPKLPGSSGGTSNTAITPRSLEN